MVSGVAGYVASQRVGQVAFAASALAAAVVWLAGGLGLLVTTRALGNQTGGNQTGENQTGENQAGVTAVLMAMLLRIGLPLGSVVLLAQLGTQWEWGARLAEAGYFGLVVVHYLVALVIETVLSVRLLSRQAPFLQPSHDSRQERAFQEAGNS